MSFVTTFTFSQHVVCPGTNLSLPRVCTRYSGDSTAASCYSNFTPPPPKVEDTLLILLSFYSQLKSFNAIRYHEDLSTHHPTCHRLWHHQRRPSRTYPLIQRCGGRKRPPPSSYFANLHVFVYRWRTKGSGRYVCSSLEIFSYSILDIYFSYSDYYIIIEYIYRLITAFNEAYLKITNITRNIIHTFKTLLLILLIILSFLCENYYSK